MYRLVDLERIISRQKADGIVYLWVFENLCWHLIQSAGSPSGFGDYAYITLCPDTPSIAPWWTHLPRLQTQASLLEKLLLSKLAQ